MKDATGNDATWNKREIHKAAAERIEEITKEFTGGFKFLEDYPRSVTFFGANQFREDNKFYADARQLAARVVKDLGYSVISGGGPGIMEAANRGAFEAGGESLGLLIKLPTDQIINKFITASFSSYYFFVRKVCLTFSSEAFIFYPGGFGTLDEFFEIVTLVQTRKIAGIPIICVGSEYWMELKAFMDKELVARGTISANDIDIFRIVDDHDEIIKIIKEVPVHTSLPFNKDTNIQTDGVKQETL